MEPKFKCELCLKESFFCTKFSLKRHQANRHSLEIGKCFSSRLKPCSFQGCAYKFIMKNELRQHLSDDHALAIKEEKLTFSSMKEMYIWKEKVELESHSKYILRTKGKQLRLGGEKLYFHCHRSSRPRRPLVEGDQRRRAMKWQGSSKMGFVCPAGIEATRDRARGPVSVSYWSAHVGHSLDLAHLTLSRSQREQIAEKLENGASMDAILDGIRGGISGEIQRIHLITRRDLRNILLRGVPRKRKEKALDPAGLEMATTVASHGEEEGGRLAEDDESEPTKVESEVVVYTADESILESDDEESESKWDDETTRMLISKRTEMDTAFRGQSRKKELWEEVAAWMASVTGGHYSGGQCKSKWGNLLTTYRNNKAREGKFLLTWPHFKAMDDLMGTPNSKGARSPLKAAPVRENELPCALTEALTTPAQLPQDPIGQTVPQDLEMSGSRELIWEHVVEPNNPPSPEEPPPHEGKVPNLHSRNSGVGPRNLLSQGHTAVFVEHPTPTLKLRIPKCPMAAQSQSDTKDSEVQLPREIVAPKSTKSLTLWIPQDVKKLSQPQDRSITNSPSQDSLKHTPLENLKPLVGAAQSSSSTEKSVLGSLQSGPKILKTFSLPEKISDTTLDSSKCSTEEPLALETSRTKNNLSRLRKRLKVANHRHESLVNRIEFVMAEHSRAIKLIERRQEKRHKETLRVLERIANTLRRIEKSGPTD